MLEFGGPLIGVDLPCRCLAGTAGIDPKLPFHQDCSQQPRRLTGSSPGVGWGTLVAPAGGGSASFSLTGRQAEPRQKELAALGVSVMNDPWDHDWGDHAKPVCDLSRFVKARHMRVAGGH